MTNRHRSRSSTVLSVGAVMVLVCAALVSSWIGIDAEQQGQQAIGEVAETLRIANDARAGAGLLAGLEIERAADALRGDAADVRTDPRARLAREQQRLHQLAARPLGESERALLAGAERLLARFSSLAEELNSMQPGARSDDGRRVAGYRLEVTAPLAWQISELLEHLSEEARRRADAVADATQRRAATARVLLIVFGSLSLVLALLLARQLGASITRGDELVERLNALARVDALTGIANRRVWDEELKRGLERARRTGLPCCVGMIDLDHFKRYNDTHGHQAGDALLRATAQALASRLRAGDLLARYGGEEFAFLLHGCSLDAGIELARQLHTSTPSGETFSAGLTESGGDEDPHEVLSRADDALYQAKREGRNRTVTIPRANRNSSGPALRRAAEPARDTITSRAES